MSHNQSIVPLVESFPPVLTITPPTMTFPPTPPLTPSSPTHLTKDSSTAHCGTKTAFKPIRTPSPATPISPAIPIPVDAPHSLHFPLTRHLALLHPNTPDQIIHFIATRLLSPDRPYGHTGTWNPIWEGCGDLATAGVGFDAGKGCKRKEGEGKERDEKMKEMYGVARESYRLLEMKSPGVEKL